jgi:tetratricopeptide (TPR) repeat protein
MTLGIPSLRAATASLLSIILCCFLYTFQRNHTLKDNFALWADCVKKSPQKARPLNNLGGNAYRDRKLYDQAITHYLQALKRWPTYSLAHNNPGTMPIAG